jgi:hypothetical protein
LLSISSTPSCAAAVPVPRRSMSAQEGGGEGDRFFTEWEETFDSFDQMGLHENLLRGIYAYGACTPARAAARRAAGAGSGCWGVDWGCAAGWKQRPGGCNPLSRPAARQQQQQQQQQPHEGAECSGKGGAAGTVQRMLAGHGTPAAAQQLSA